MGNLPEQTDANLQTLGGVAPQLETTSNNLRSEQDRLSLIERQIQAVRQGAASAPAGLRLGRCRRRRSSGSTRCNATWQRHAASTPTSTRRSWHSKTN